MEILQTPPAAAEKKKHPALRLIFHILGQLLFALLALILMVAITLGCVCNLIFNGPSPTARNVLTMSMLESSGMKWFPALFIGEETVEEIQASVSAKLPEEVSDVSQIFIQTDDALAGENSEWANYPDGIRIEQISGDTYTAHVMLIRDPSRVYVAAANRYFSKDEPVVRIGTIIERENAAAGVNGGAFNDDGTQDPGNGRLPIGLVVSKGEVVWTSGGSYDGFVGFTEDDTLVVATTMNKEKAQQLNIRDGCCFGPVLIMNGMVNEEAYNTNSGYNPRTCIGQRADGAVILLCIDGRQANSLGGTYADATDILVEYGAINACNLDGGSSSIMYYRDTEGRYGEPGALQMINNYSLLQEQPRPMPTFILVAPEENGG